MKIVFLNIYNGLVERGAERSTHELANRLAENHKVWVVQGGSRLLSKAKYKIKIIPTFLPNFPDSSFSFLRRFYLDIWSLQILFFSIRLIPLLLSERFNIVIPVNGGWQTVLCKLLAWLRYSKLVIIGRAGKGRDDRWNLLWRPDLFIALTNYAYAWVKKIAPKIKCELIPNGVDLNLFRPQREKAEVALKRPIILCVGALMPNKQIDLTIKATAKLKDVSLLILGKGILKNDLLELGNKLLEKDRFLILSVPYKEIPKYYRIAHVFTLVSKTGEAFGNVYLEALASNLPIVATDDTTRREIVGGAGIFVDPNNIDQYADALNTMLNKNIGNMPIDQSSKFYWEKIASKYEKTFLSLS